MTYRQAQFVAIIKRILGWIVFTLALLSTTISIINFIYVYNWDAHELGPTVKDFIRVFVEMLRANTGFLDYFWVNSPLPTVGTGFSQNNLLFLFVYFLMFVGLALSASGARISRQLKSVKEKVEDMAIIEQLKEKEEAETYQQLMSKLRFPHHTIFLQIFRLYVLPIVIAVAAYYLLSYLQSLGF